MINPNKIILKESTYGDCLKKNRTVLKKCIIAKMVDLNLFFYNDELRLCVIDEKIEDELRKKKKHELVEILMNENNEMQSIHSEVKEMVRLKKEEETK